MSDTRNFKTLLAATVAYYQAHPSYLACYGLLSRAEDEGRGLHITAWLLTTFPWNDPVVQTHLVEEVEAFQAASAQTQRSFLAAKDAAIRALRPAANDDA